MRIKLRVFFFYLNAPQWPAAHEVMEPVQLQYMDMKDGMSKTELYGYRTSSHLKSYFFPYSDLYRSGIL